MSAAQRKLYTFTFSKADKGKLKLTFFIDNKDQQRLRGYIAKLKCFTIDQKGHKVHVYSHLSYKNGYLTIKFTPQIQQLLQEKGNFTLLDFTVHKALRGKYAKTLYELLSQFRITGKVEIKLETLKQRIGITKCLYKSDMIHRAIRPALAQIQAQTGISCTYLLSNNYFQLTFQQTSKQTPMKNPKFKKTDRQKVYQTLLKEGMSPYDALPVSENLSSKALYALQLRKHEKDPRKRIVNLPAYAIKIYKYKQQSPQLQLCGQT